MGMAAYLQPRSLTIPTKNPYHSSTKIVKSNCNVGTLVPSLTLPRKYKPNNKFIRAHLIELKATRKVTIPFKEQGRRGEEYIKETERIVRITFPDSSRIKYLGDNVWQAQLKPVSFFTVTANPFCDLKVLHNRNSLHLSSNRLVLDFIGIPEMYDGFDFMFSVQGELTVHKESSSVMENECCHSFRGWVTMGLNADLPLPLSSMPDYIIVPVGNGILDRILGAMEGELTSRITRDYNAWCCKVSGQIIGTAPQALAP